MNPMKEILIEKITLNMGVGESGPKLEKTKRILEKISGAKVVKTASRRRSTFGVPKGKEIGVKTTMRGGDLKKTVQRLLKAVGNTMKMSQFDAQGNFSFGVAEYIEIPGMDYEPEIGIVGLDVSVTLKRRGYRVKRRKYRKATIGKRHRITPEEAIEWAKKELGVVLS
jgi:large subunit ribosomal protein L5